MTLNHDKRRSEDRDTLQCLWANSDTNSVTPSEWTSMARVLCGWLITVMNEDLRIEIPYNSCGLTMILTMCELENGLRCQGFCVVDP